MKIFFHAWEIFISNFCVSYCLILRNRYLDRRTCRQTDKVTGGPARCRATYRRWAHHWSRRSHPPRHTSSVHRCSASRLRTWTDPLCTSPLRSKGQHFACRKLHSEHRTTSCDKGNAQRCPYEKITMACTGGSKAERDGWMDSSRRSFRELHVYWTTGCLWCCSGYQCTYCDNLPQLRSSKSSRQSSWPSHSQVSSMHRKLSHCTSPAGQVTLSAGERPESVWDLTEDRTRGLSYPGVCFTSVLNIQTLQALC